MTIKGIGLRGGAALGLFALLGVACTGGGTQDSASSEAEGEQVVELQAAELASDVVSAPTTIASGETHDADVTIDPETGRIYAIWAVNTGSKPNKVTGDPPQDVLVASSDDDGATWSKPVRVNDTPGVGNAGFNTQARITVVGPDEVLVLWPSKETLSKHSSAYYVMMDRSTDGGKTFGKDRSILSAEGQTSQLYGAVTSAGKKVYAAFLDYRQDVDDSAPRMPIGVGFVSSKNGGKTFGTTQRAVLRSCECCDNAVAVDSEGTLYVAYRSQESAGPKTTIRDVAVVRSYDDGATWSNPAFMGRHNWVFNGCPESGPELDIGQDDVLHGVYWTGKDGEAGVYYTKSTDGGKTFEDPMVVATDDFYPPPYLDLTEGPDGAAWLVWDDRREAEKKVHLGKIVDGELSVLDNLSPGVTPAIDGTGDKVVMVWSDPSGLQFAQIDGA